MEISMKNFWNQLPRILISIAESEFVAVDAEMTGISDSVSDLENNGRPNREDMYRNGKRIASTFNVFEFGFTCVKADGDGSYKTESYSYYVSPLLLEETKEDSAFAKRVDRKLTTSLETLKFIKREGLRLEKIFEDPVPYLSRKEEREAMDRCHNRNGKVKITDTTRKIETSASSEDMSPTRFPPGFLCAVRIPSEIKIYIPLSDSKKRNRVYVDLVRLAAQRDVPSMKCRVWDHGATVRIYAEDSDEEKERSGKFMNRFEHLVRKQTGLRIIIEALAAASKLGPCIDPILFIDALSSPDSSMTAQQFCQEVEAKFGQACTTCPPASASEWVTTEASTQESPSGSWAGSRGDDDGDDDDNGEGRRSYDYESIESIEDQIWNAFNTLEHRLTHSRRIIVGHNIFWDLLFLYQTFIDDLPDTSEEFFARIHELFPCILDTKVIAIRAQPIEGEDPLADLFERFDRRNARPHISWDTAYGFGRTASVHEAGYDSFMTATVLLRLGHKLARETLNDGLREPKSWRKRLRKLYSKGWLTDVKCDPTCFDSDSETEADPWLDKDADSDVGEEDVVGRLDWHHPVFEASRNIVRIGPYTNVNVDGRSARP